MGYTRYPTTNSGAVLTYANQAALPVTATDGTLAVTLDTDPHTLWIFDLALGSWQRAAGIGFPSQVGALDGFAASPNGGTISSTSLFLQSASASNPGLVSSAAQTFAGVKTFNSAPNLASLTASAPLRTDSSKNITVGSISLTNDVTGNLPISQTSGSVSLVNQVVGNLPLSQTSGSISLTTQVSGLLPAANGGSTGSNTGDVSLTVVGTTPATQGASLSGQVLTLQPADSTNPGVVSTTSQTFLGAKTFSNQVLVSTGSALAPGLAFSTEITTGLYRVGSGDMGISVANNQTLDMTCIGQGLVNWGINSSASATADVPFKANRTQNSPVYYVWGNASAGAASVTVFQIANGAGSNYTTVENHANATGTYLGGGSAFLGGSNQLQTIFGSEYSSSSCFLGFVTRGRVAGSERMRLNEFYLSLRGGVGLQLTGSSISGGILSFLANNSTSAYSVTWPGAQGAASTVPQNNGSGVLTWASVLTNPMTTSGDLVVGSASGAPARFAAGTDGQVLTANSASSLGLQWSRPAIPSFQTYSSGTGMTYTIPVNCRYIRYRIMGGGGGGAGSGTSPGATTNGGRTNFLLNFGPSTTQTFYGDGGAGAVTTTGGAGGATNGGDITFTGAAGGLSNAIANSAGGAGGNGLWGGGGDSGNAGGGTGGSAAANTGGGGGGAGQGATNSAGAGGGSGGYIEGFYIGSAGGTITITVGDAGKGGTAGTGGGTGGAGAQGRVIIEQYFY